MGSKNKFVPMVLVLLVVMIVFAIVTPSMALAADFTGTWMNKDTSTRGMVKFTITPGTFHGYGACSPTPCDWGTTPLTLYSKSVSDSNNIAGTAEYNFGFSKTIITLRSVNPTSIRASVYTEFTDSNGRHHYINENMMFVPMQISTPTQLSPKNGATFSNYPRTTTLTWSPVQGAASYAVEIDCYQCCESNKWCTEVGKTWTVVPGITTTSYTFNFVGAQPGRWRVWAVDANGQASPKSDWWYFTYTV